uniref:Uncharacterized protein n=1 Tax=Lygus hesperus TaxID=30085 RepID=A0A146LN43_LYGHE
MSRVMTKGLKLAVLRSEGLKSRMWFVGALCCAFLVGQAKGLKSRRQTCLKKCSFDAQECCVTGEPFDVVELEASISILTGNDVLSRIEEELLLFARESDQQQHQQQQRLKKQVKNTLTTMEEWEYKKNRIVHRMSSRI